MALYSSTVNRIVDIVPRLWKSFGAETGAELVQLLRGLSRFAHIELEAVVLEHDDYEHIVVATCRGKVETIRVPLHEWWFPPREFLAYVNAKLADAGRQDRLVACRDGVDEAVALCDPDQQMELRACIFAILDDLRWPAAQIDGTEREILEAIRTAPDDDGPRMVYADYLTEKGDRRGEFIMLQCHADLEVRQRALPILDVHRATWTCHLPPWVRAPAFSRGFVHRARATADDMRRYGGQLAAIIPVPIIDLG